MVKIGIVGGGIMGLSSAIRLQCEFPDVEITLISEKFSPETTADGAAGIWGPYLLGETPPKDVEKWSKETHDFFRDLWNSENGGKIGISMIPCCRVSSSEEYPEPEWKDVVYGFRPLTDAELKAFGKPSLRKGYGFTTFTCEASKLLPYFLEKFKINGGRVIKRKIDNLHALRKEFDIVVNCTGIGAHHLALDKTVQPKRGQVMRVHAPYIKWAILDDDDDGNYIIPNQDACILGGTHQEGDWNCSIYEDDTKFITKGCFSIVPSLKDAPLIREWVGLRPGRPSVRLEMEVMQYPGEKPFFLCSNYGHGGSGLTLFWGCAKDIVCNVKNAMAQIRTKSKL